MEKPTPDPWEESARIVESFGVGGSDLLTELLARIAATIRERGGARLTAEVSETDPLNDQRLTGRKVLPEHSPPSGEIALFWALPVRPTPAA
jgi:hypothetical protein